MTMTATQAIQKVVALERQIEALTERVDSLERSVTNPQGRCEIEWQG